MKTLAIIYGASSSGKTTFTNKLKGKCAVLNTDELYTVSVSRDYTMASGARETDIKRVESIWWMPWHVQAMKDVARCDKRRGVVS